MRIPRLSRLGIVRALFVLVALGVALGTVGMPRPADAMTPESEPAVITTMESEAAAPTTTAGSSSATPPPAEAAPPIEAEEADRSRRGLRFEAGAFVIAHRRTEHDDGPIAAPGLALGLSYTLTSWQFAVEARGAYLETNRRILVFAAAGARARWFTSPAADTVGFFNFGVDAVAMAAERAFEGYGPSAHLGGGLEVFHRSAHHRLAVELGVELPMFKADGRVYGDDFAGWEDDKIYVVPISLAVRWTF